MARSTNRSTADGESRVSAPTDRGEARDLSEPRELSLEEVLKSYEQPVNEEQAWAVCYQCCSGLRVPRPPARTATRVKDPSSILLHRDGTVSLQPGPGNSGRTSVRHRPSRRSGPSLRSKQNSIRKKVKYKHSHFLWGLNSRLNLA